LIQFLRVEEASRVNIPEDPAFSIGCPRFFKCK
jgi:hypothetical protein